METSEPGNHAHRPRPARWCGKIQRPIHGNPAILRRRLVTIAPLLLASGTAGGQSRHWLDLGVGLGGENTSAGDSIFSASAQYELHAALSHAITPRLFARVSALSDQVFGPQSDCPTSSRRCPNAAQQIGAVAQLLVPLNGADPFSAPALGGGVGLYKLRSAGGGGATITTPAINVRLDFPFITGEAVSWTFAADGTLLTRMAGGTAWLVIVSTGLRIR
jgi:hypothetical protein